MTVPHHVGGRTAYDQATPAHCFFDQPASQGLTGTVNRPHFAHGWLARIEFVAAQLHRQAHQLAQPVAPLSGSLKHAAVVPQC